uniref:hypothetical protein n=1 Tax=Candidatus Scatomorpha intestinigallinarum TaxID=2840923 RepID=UPI004025C12F
MSGEAGTEILKVAAAAFFMGASLCGMLIGLERLEGWAARLTVIPALIYISLYAWLISTIAQMGGIKIIAATAFAGMSLCSSRTSLDWFDGWRAKLPVITAGIVALLYARLLASVFFS